MGRRFLRKSNDKIVGGICSGLAQYVGADVTLVRLIALFGIIASGIIPGAFLYVICLIIVPLDSHAGGGYYTGAPGAEDFDSSNYNPYDSRSNNPSSDRTRYVIGIGLVGIGIYLFARLFFGWLKWEYVFAGLLIIGGLFMMFGGSRRGGR